jgi:hypothetical protein
MRGAQLMKERQFCIIRSHLQQLLNMSSTSCAKGIGQKNQTVLNQTHPEAGKIWSLTQTAASSSAATIGITSLHFISLQLKRHIPPTWIPRDLKS